MTDTLLLDIDHLAYPEALRLMHGLVEVKKDVGFPEILILVEHEPVLTMGRRSVEADIHVSSESLKEKGIAIHKIERGGLITYHGPGQLVAYPLFNLRKLKLGVHDMVERLEAVILRTLWDYNIDGQRKPEFRGIWVGKEKIASIGLAVRRGITFHGLALNYSPDMSHFDLITPCGIPEVQMTSMERLLSTGVEPGRLRRVMADSFSEIFNLTLSPWDIKMAWKAAVTTD
jgi:lipoate-protein ligase B